MEKYINAFDGLVLVLVSLLMAGSFASLAPRFF